MRSMSGRSASKPCRLIRVESIPPTAQSADRDTDARAIAAATSVNRGFRYARAFSWYRHITLVPPDTV